MNLVKLYDIAEKENVKIYDYKINNDINGIFLNYEKNNVIGLNCDNNVQEKCVLAEELGHYYCGSTYKLNSNIQTISKQEYKAKKWSYNVLVPFEKLKSAILNRN